MLLRYVEVSALGETVFKFVLVPDNDQVEGETGRVLGYGAHLASVRADQPKPIAAIPAENVGRSRSRRTLRWLNPFILAGRIHLSRVELYYLRVRIFQLHTVSPYVHSQFKRVSLTVTGDPMLLRPASRSRSTRTSRP